MDSWACDIEALNSSAKSVSGASNTKGQDLFIQSEEIVCKQNQNKATSENSKIESARLSDDEHPIPEHYTAEELQKTKQMVSNWIERNSIDNDDDDFYSDVYSEAPDIGTLSEITSISRNKGPTESFTNVLAAFKLNFKLGNDEKSQANTSIAASLPSIKAKKNALPLWVELEKGNHYDVIITDFSAPDRFFVQLTNDAEGQHVLDKLLQRAKLERINNNYFNGDFCLIQHDGRTHRAMIERHTDMSSMCFCVDTGQLFNFFEQFHPPIYKLPRKIQEAASFKAIRCKFSGLEFPYYMMRCIECIDNNVLKKIQKPVVYVVDINEASRDNEDPMDAMVEYEVILYDAVGNRNINELLIQKNYAKVKYV